MIPRAQAPLPVTKRRHQKQEDRAPNEKLSKALDDRLYFFFKPFERVPPPPSFQNLSKVHF